MTPVPATIAGTRDGRGKRLTRGARVTARVGPRATYGLWRAFSRSASGRPSGAPGILSRTGEGDVRGAAATGCRSGNPGRWVPANMRIRRTGLPAKSPKQASGIHVDGLSPCRRMYGPPPSCRREPRMTGWPAPMYSAFCGVNGPGQDGTRPLSSLLASRPRWTSTDTRFGKRRFDRYSISAIRRQTWQDILSFPAPEPDTSRYCIGPPTRSSAACSPAPQSRRLDGYARSVALPRRQSGGCRVSTARESIQGIHDLNWAQRSRGPARAAESASWTPNGLQMRAWWRGIWSGRRDLNSGPLAPQASALARLRHGPITTILARFSPRFFPPRSPAPARGRSRPPPSRRRSSTPGGLAEPARPWLCWL